MIVNEPLGWKTMSARPAVHMKGGRPRSAPSSPQGRPYISAPSPPPDISSPPFSESRPEVAWDPRCPEVARLRCPWAPRGRMQEHTGAGIAKGPLTCGPLGGRYSNSIATLLKSLEPTDP